jgi:hypothetical protein
MSIQGMKDVLDELDELIEAIMKQETLTDDEGKELVDMEQLIHEKLAVVYDKFDIAVGDERVD